MVIFFTGFCIMLWFRLVARRVLVTHWCFDCCWASFVHPLALLNQQLFECLAACLGQYRTIVFVNRESLNSSWKESQEVIFPSLCTKQNWVKGQTSSFRALFRLFLKLSKMETAQPLWQPAPLIDCVQREKGIICVPMEYLFLSSCQLSQVDVTHYSVKSIFSTTTPQAAVRSP